MTLWEILKANKTGIAPDMFTMLAANKLNGGRDRLHELTGTPPLSFKAKGKSLSAWSITGNTVQNGTPTPENPVDVQGVGDYDSETGLYKIPVVTRGKNLLDYKIMFQNSKVFNDYFNSYNLVLNPYTEYEISTNGEEKIFTNPFLQNKETQFIVCNTSELFSTVNGGVSYKKKLFKTTGADGVLVVGYRTKGSPPVGVNIVNKADMDAGILWLNIIQTPITTPIYLDAPLYKIEGYADMLSTTEEVRIVKELVLTGEENFSYDDTYTRFTLKIPNARATSNRSDETPCTHYISIHDGRSIYDVPDDSIYVTVGGGYVYINIKDITYTSLADFKSYLAAQYAAGTPVKVYYVMQTPETKTVEPVEIPTLNGTTVIDVDTAVKPESMTIKYRR